ncbi:PstS family phosphate ABC transporter substrate-binding protein [Leptolyngbya sp. FACHB-541]|uniref:PstS family phosphate ABC transporter substrate-binding protein n=1 Tax=Leptolyngbya sp. FACHB-541 TaxID=2692810 RepID=UPI0016840996|nr:PstS family phosphate ABC transporter substrate-binding protein [Leptolyngbya sp. FACHB-541]MBD1998633.1 PstS family phosphate ABC transporter substrate-binding protein [Leptolyngbya sp. FACHB-541]
MLFQLRSKRFAYLAASIALTFVVSSCAGGGTDTSTEAPEGETAEAPAEGGGDLSGTIAIDGSSTVFPISEAMAEEFMAANNGVQVTVGTSGTGGGFEKFCAGETQISNASRIIEADEIAACEAAGIEFIELPVAQDALTVVVNPENDWAECMTIEQLNTMWAPEAQGTVSNWNQVDPSFPDAPLALYGPGTDSGTFDYFTDVVNGEEGASRGDYTSSEDDNVIVQGVVGDPNALGYFGYAYYEENADSLKAVQVDGGEGCVAPSAETVLDGSYAPLSRPLFIYVSTAALEEPHIQEFLNFYVDEANASLVEEVGYVPLGDELTPLVQARLENGVTGSAFAEAAEGASLPEILAQ